jgi:hypothetical protein
MTGFLLDTNCISEIVRLKPEPRVMAWIEAAEETLLYLSVLTLGEIRKGLAALPQGKRRSRLETWLEVELQARSIKGRVKRKNASCDWKEQKRLLRSPAQVMLRGSEVFALRRSILFCDGAFGF